MACLRLLKAEWIFDFSAGRSGRAPWVAGYRGGAKRMKLGIQRHRYPANPKKDCISVFDVEMDIRDIRCRVDIRDFLLVVIYLFVGVKRTPR